MKIIKIKAKWDADLTIEQDLIMHVSTDIRVLKCLDGLYYSFELLEFNYGNLYEICCSIAEDQSNLIQALSQCWSFVDFLHRIREISQAIPGLSKRNRILIDFLINTKNIELYRNYIQHLRKELSKRDISPFPVWGSLAWADPEDNTNSFLAIIGAQIQGTSYGGCVYDTVNQKWVSRVTLGIENMSLNFDPVYEATLKFKEFIIPWLITNYEPGIKLKNEIPITSIKFLTESNTK